MMRTPFTHLLAPADILWKTLEDYSYDAYSVFLEVGIDQEMLLQPGARVAHVKAEALWEKVTQLIEDPCFGLRAAKFWHPSHLHALGHALLASCTLREALERVSRYAHLVGEDREFQIEDTSEGTVITLSSSLVQPPLMDLSMAILLSACRMNYGSILTPISVSFIHPQPSCMEQYESFFQSRITFQAESDCLVLPTSAVEKRLPIGNPYLANINDQHIIHYLATMEKNKIASLVRSAIVDMMPSGLVSEEKAAAKLNLSTRSLQRKLRSDHTTFKQLLNDVRQELAKSYIHDPSVSLMEIAFLLGYSEYSSFSRAFKRWTNTSPSKARHSRQTPQDISRPHPS